MDPSNDKIILMKNRELELEIPSSVKPEICTARHFSKSITFPLEMSQETMKETFYLHPEVLLFFKIMGAIWPSKNLSFFEKSCQAAWCSIIRLFLIFMGAFALATMSLFIWIDGPEYILLNVAIGITLLMQCLVLFPALKLIANRLSKPIPLYDIPFYEQSLRLSYFLCTSIVLIGLITPVLDIFAYKQYLYDFSTEGVSMVLILGQMSISCILTTTFLFIMVDCKVASSIIDSLVLECRQKSLTIETICHARNEINSRVHASKNTNNSILFVAILDIACVIIILLFGLKVETLYVTISQLCMLVKEIPFLLIVLYLSAEVNEKSDAFVRELGLNIWDIEQDHARVMLYVNAEAKKISFPLAGMRLRKVDLKWKFATWLIALLIGVLKAIILSIV